MPYLTTPSMIVLDIDGVINSSSIAKLACNGYVSRMLAEHPILKKAALEALEICEVLLNIKYEPNENLIRLKRNAPYLAIVTDRSLLGLTTAFGKKNYLLNLMDIIQVRKSLFSNNRRKLKYGPDLWKAKDVKPNESVLHRPAAFAKQKGIKPHDVLIIEDDPVFRFIAKSRFGFRVEPDDTIDEVAKDYTSSQLTIAPV